jgi:hypothetical protein
MATDYGHDLSCTYRTVVLPMPDGSTAAVTAVQPSLDGAEVSGRACLAEALVRRLATSRGTLIDVVAPSTTANYGNDVLGLLNEDVDARTLAMMGASVNAEMRKDERVVDAETRVTLIPGIAGPNSLLLDITITDGVGPFKLVLMVSQVTVQLLSGPS